MTQFVNRSLVSSHTSHFAQHCTLDRHRPKETWPSNTFFLPLPWPAWLWLHPSRSDKIAVPYSKPSHPASKAHIGDTDSSFQLPVWRHRLDRIDLLRIWIDLQPRQPVLLPVPTRLCCKLQRFNVQDHLRSHLLDKQGQHQLGIDLQGEHHQCKLGDHLKQAVDHDLWRRRHHRLVQRQPLCGRQPVGQLVLCF